MSKIENENGTVLRRGVVALSEFPAGVLSIEEAARRFGVVLRGVAVERDGEGVVATTIEGPPLAVGSFALSYAENDVPEADLVTDDDESEPKFEASILLRFEDASKLVTGGDDGEEYLSGETFGLLVVSPPRVVPPGVIDGRRGIYSLTVRGTTDDLSAFAFEYPAPVPIAVDSADARAWNHLDRSGQPGYAFSSIDAETARSLGDAIEEDRRVYGAPEPADPAPVAPGVYEGDETTVTGETIFTVTTDGYGGVWLHETSSGRYADLSRFGYDGNDSDRLGSAIDRALDALEVAPSARIEGDI